MSFSGNGLLTNGQKSILTNSGAGRSARNDPACGVATATRHEPSGRVNCTDPRRSGSRSVENSTTGYTLSCLIEPESSPDPERSLGPFNCASRMISLPRTANESSDRSSMQNRSGRSLAFGRLLGVAQGTPILPCGRTSRSKTSDIPASRNWFMLWPNGARCKATDHLTAPSLPG